MLVYLTLYAAIYDINQNKKPHTSEKFNNRNTKKRNALILMKNNTLKTIKMYNKIIFH